MPTFIYTRKRVLKSYGYNVMPPQATKLGEIDALMIIRQDKALCTEADFEYLQNILQDSNILNSDTNLKKWFLKHKHKKGFIALKRIKKVEILISKKKIESILDVSKYLN